MSNAVLEQKSMFDPAAFIGRGWMFAEARDQRSASLGLLDDYSGVKLSTDWLEGKSIVDGETRRMRILADASRTPLNADHFFDLWNNKEKIPEEWKLVKSGITFDGDIVRLSGGDGFVLYLYWNNGWRWSVSWIGFEWSTDYPSAVLAS